MYSLVLFSCVVERGYLLWPVHSLGKTLLAFALLHFVLQGKICLLLQVSLDFLVLHYSPLWWKRHLFGVLVLESFVSLHRTVQFQHLQNYWLGIDLYYCDTELFSLETNRDHSVVFEIAPKYYISDSVFDYDGYSISSKVFLPRVVCIIGIWIKFPHCSLFWFTDS